MPRRRRPPSSAVPWVKPPGHPAELRRALTKRKNSDLVDILVELAEAGRGVLRRLTARFDVVATADESVAATRQAIADATTFDKRDINVFVQRGPLLTPGCAEREPERPLSDPAFSTHRGQTLSAGSPARFVCRMTHSAIPAVACPVNRLPASIR
jgi:hypothetical protein